jgi:hypothetical protein
MVSTSKPTFTPTKALRDTVRLLRADQWSDRRIAARLGIKVDMLRKHFAADLKEGSDQEREQALKLLKRAARKLNVAAIKEYIRITGAARSVEEFLSAANPERPVRIRPKGKKEVAHEVALHAHEAGEWGEDLVPLPSRFVN